MARRARPRLPAATPALADLLRQQVLLLSPQALECPRRTRRLAKRADRAQLPPVAALPVSPRGHVRAVGDQPIRTAVIRNLLQDLYGKGLGHLLLRAESGMGRPADQRSLLEDGPAQHVSQAEYDDQDADRGVRIPPSGSGDDVECRQRRNRAARRPCPTERRRREDPENGNPDRRRARPLERRRADLPRYRLHIEHARHGARRSSIPPRRSGFARPPSS